MTRWIAAALCVVIGCVSAPSQKLVRVADPAIRYGGFFDLRRPNAPRFAWPGTHIAARFTGTTLRAKLTSTPVEDETRETDWIEVIIDGGEPRTFALGEGEHEYPLADKLEPGAHHALIWKRTEAEVGTITFHGFVVDEGSALGPAVPEPARRVVFVGDSITAGYGNEGPSDSCGWSAAYENNYTSYGAITARALGAEYVATAWSGKGVWRNYDPRDELTMPQLYQRIIPTEPDSPLAPVLRADAVIVNLGTNDFGRGAPDEAQLIAAFGAFLAELRARYPQALVVLMLGPMLYDDPHGVPQRSLMRAWLTKLRDARRALGDARVELFEAWADPKEGQGCEGHPSAKTHARIGHELAALLSQRLGW